MSNTTKTNMSLIAAEREMEKQLYVAAKILRENPSDTSRAFCDLFFAINKFNQILQGYHE